MSDGPGLHDQVDSRQAGPDQGDRVVGSQAIQHPRRPGIRDIPLGKASPLQVIGILGLRVSQREDDPVDRNPLTGPRRQLDRPPSVAGPHFQVDDLVPHEVDHRGRALRGSRQQLLDIIAVDAPRCERAVVCGRVAGSEPVEEVRRLIGQGAHEAGRDIEQVLVAARTIGQPSGQPVRFLEEQDARGPGPGHSRHVDGHHRPAEPAPDDRDVRSRLDRPEWPEAAILRTLVPRPDSPAEVDDDGLGTVPD